MGRIKNVSLYPLDKEINLEEYLVGTDGGGGITMNYKLKQVLASFADAGPQLTILYSDVEGVTYDYHAGNKYNGSWIVIRYNQDNITTRLVATQDNNPMYLNVHNAWSNKETLTYK